MKISEPKDAKSAIKRSLISLTVTRLLKREDAFFTKVLIDVINANAPVYEQSANVQGCEIVYYYNTTITINGQENLFFLN